MIRKFLEAGQIVSTHGIHGEVRMNPWTDSPEFMKQFTTLYYDGNGEKSVHVISARPHGNIVLLKLEGVDTVEEAAALRNQILYIRREDTHLPEGQYFIDELTGCKVYDAEDGSICYGTVSAVSETGSNDVWHISRNGREYLIPAIPQVVKETNVAENFVKITPLKGIFEDEN